jgi:hypothetical protein
LFLVIRINVGQKQKQNKIEDEKKMSKSKKKIEDDLQFELYVTPTSSFVRREKKYDNETSKFEKKNFRVKLDPKSFIYL